MGAKALPETTRSPHYSISRASCEATFDEHSRLMHYDFCLIAMYTTHRLPKIHVSANASWCYISELAASRTSSAKTLMAIMEHGSICKIKDVKSRYTNNHAVVYVSFVGYAVLSADESLVARYLFREFVHSVAGGCATPNTTYELNSLTYHSAVEETVLQEARGQDRLWILHKPSRLSVPHIWNSSFPASAPNASPVQPNRFQED